MKSLNIVIALVLSSLLITGCASGVTRQSPDDQKRVVRISKDNPVSKISLTITDEAKEKVSDNLKFDPNQLKDHIQRAMNAQSLIDPQADVEAPVLEIEVKDFRVRTNFSAVMFGFMAGADSITGDIVLKNPNGAEIDRFEVSASYALGGFAGGQDTARMDWLYEKFAEETVNELTKK